MKKLSKVLALILGLVMVLTCFALADFSAPDHGLKIDVNDKTIKVFATRAGQVAPLILGANLASASNLGGMQDANSDNPNSLLGMFGSDVNSAPDPYLYNYFFNEEYAEGTDYVKITPAITPVFQLDGTAPPIESVQGALINRPDLILTQAAGIGTNVNSTFPAVVATLPENIDTDPSNDYAPSYYSCSISSLVYQCENLKSLAGVMKSMMDDNSMTARYGDPTVIAADYDKYVWGMYFYFQEKLQEAIDAEGYAKKTVAIVSSTSDNGANWTMPTRATKVDAQKPNRLVEYCRDNCVLLSDALGTSATLAQVLSNHVVIAIGNGDVLRQAAQNAGVAEENMPVIIDTLPNCLYGMVMQTHENALGIPYLQSYIYSDLVGNEINPAYAAAYYYQKFYHISDDSALQEAISVLLDGASLPDGVTADLDDYDPAAIESMIEEGADYAISKGLCRHDDPSSWDPDMTVGIGSSNQGDASYISDSYEVLYAQRNGGGGYDVPQPSPSGSVPPSTSPSPSPSPVPFGDVPSGSWYYDAVSYAYNRGLFQGVTDTSFAPGLTMTRAMFVTVLGRMCQVTVNQTEESTFGDVPIDGWSTGYINWAQRSHLVSGNGEAFQPGEPISREQMATILYNYAKWSGHDVSNIDRTKLNSFADGGTVSSWAADATAWAVNLGILKGGDGALRPGASASRAEVAQIFYNFCSLLSI